MESAAEECDGMNVAVCGPQGENSGDRIVRSVSFYNGGQRRVEMVKNGSTREGPLEEREGFLTSGRPVPSCSLACESSKGN